MERTDSQQKVQVSNENNKKKQEERRFNDGCNEETGQMNNGSDTNLGDSRSISKFSVA